MSGKRSLADTSPEQTLFTPKRQQGPTTRNMSVGQMSVENLEGLIEGLLDKKNANLATKEDIAGIHNEIQKLREKNVELATKLDEVQHECKLLKKEVDFLSKKSSEKNIILRVPKRPNIDLREEVNNVFSALAPGETVSISSIRQLPSDYGTCNILVETNSTDCVNVMLRGSSKLKGTGIYVHRDYPPEKRKVRQVLLKVRKAVKTCKGDVEVKIKGESLIVAGKTLNWCRENGLIYNTTDGCHFLRELFSDFSLTNAQLVNFVTPRIQYTDRDSRHQANRFEDKKKQENKLSNLNENQA